MQYTSISCENHDSDVHVYVKSLGKVIYGVGRATVHFIIQSSIHLRAKQMSLIIMPG